MKLKKKKIKHRSVVAPPSRIHKDKRQKTRAQEKYETEQEYRTDRLLTQL